MMVFWLERLALLATPKTASTAIEAALGSLAAVVIQRPKALKHTDVGHFEAYWQPYLSQASGGRFAVAALIREPRDWLGSWYRDGRRDDVEPEKSTANLSFDDFVLAYCNVAHRPAFADVGSQSGFLTSDTGARIDHLFRYEDLTKFVDFLEDQLNFEIHLPLLNVSPKAETRLSPSVDLLLQKTCAADFALYDSVRPKP